MLPNNIKSRDMVGMHVKLCRNVMNGAGIVVPKGTVVEITSVARGFSIKTDPCPCCGLYARIRGITRAEVELV